MTSRSSDESRDIGNRASYSGLLLGRKMVSDAELTGHLPRVLQNADRSTTTTGAIQKQSETDLGLYLSDRQALIAQQVNVYRKEPGELDLARRRDCVRKGEDLYFQEQEEHGEVAGKAMEPESKLISKPRQTNHEPDSGRFRAKINPAMEASVQKKGVKPQKRKRSRGGSGVERVEKVSVPTKKISQTEAGGGSGFHKIWSLSPELQAIVGEPELSRPQVVKRLWAYMKENQLQNPKNKKRVTCNNELRVLFGTDTTNIFAMNKLLSKHLSPIERPAQGESEPKKLKIEEAVIARPATIERYKNENEDGGTFLVRTAETDQKWPSIKP